MDKLEIDVSAFEIDSLQFVADESESMERMCAAFGPEFANLIKSDPVNFATSSYTHIIDVLNRAKNDFVSFVRAFSQNIRDKDVAAKLGNAIQRLEGFSPFIYKVCVRIILVAVGLPIIKKLNIKAINHETIKLIIDTVKATPRAEIDKKHLNRIVDLRNYLDSIGSVCIKVSSRIPAQDRELASLKHDLDVFGHDFLLTKSKIAKEEAGLGNAPHKLILFLQTDGSRISIAFFSGLWL